MRSGSVVVAAKKPELRRVAGGFGQVEVPEGMPCDQPAAWRALQQAFLDQERLDDLLDRVARLRQCGGQRLDPDRPATIVLGNGEQVAAVHGVEAKGVDLKLEE